MVACNDGRMLLFLLFMALVQLTMGACVLVSKGPRMHRRITGHMLSPILFTSLLLLVSSSPDRVIVAIVLGHGVVYVCVVLVGIVLVVVVGLLVLDVVATFLVCLFLFLSHRLLS